MHVNNCPLTCSTFEQIFPIFDGVMAHGYGWSPFHKILSITPSAKFMLITAFWHACEQLPLDMLNFWTNFPDFWWRNGTWVWLESLPQNIIDNSFRKVHANNCLLTCMWTTAPWHAQLLNKFSRFLMAYWHMGMPGVPSTKYENENKENYFFTKNCFMTSLPQKK